MSKGVFCCKTNYRWSVVGFEAINSMVVSKEKSMFIKLDMAKAYDRVKWEILHKILIAFGFSQECVNWMMRCVSSLSFHILINGESPELFGASKGLHQGYTLSL